MSSLGDNLDDTISTIKGLAKGDDWKKEFESHLDDVREQLNSAAPDTIRNADGTIGADVDNESVNASEGSIDSLHAEEAGITGRHPFKTGIQAAISGSGTDAAPWEIDQDLLETLVLGDNAGRAHLESGRFVSAGLTWPNGPDYQQTALYLSGNGLRSTTLQESADKDPSDALVEIYGHEGSDGNDGNFGGLSGMTVWGETPQTNGGVGGPLIRHDPANVVGTRDRRIIDLQFKDLIVRYSGGPGIVNKDCKGAVYNNIYTESHAGTALDHEGTLSKFINLHAITSDIIYDITGSECQAANMTAQYADQQGFLWNSAEGQSVNTNSRNNDGVAFDIQGARSSHTNLIVQDNVHKAIECNSQGIQLSNVICVDAATGDDSRSVIDVRQPRNLLSNVYITNDTQGGRGIQVREQGTELSNVTVRGSISQQALRIEASDVLASNIHIDITSDFPDQQLRFTTDATECVVNGLTGIDLTNVLDEGTRNLVNGRGTNDGNPATGGEWNGYADYAEAQGATIHDETNDDLYTTIGGSWYQMNVTAA